MKASLPSRILLSTLLYATLLVTTMAIPLVLAPHDGIAFIQDATAAPMNTDVRTRSSIDASPADQVWDRVPGLDIKPNIPAGREALRAPHAELPAAQQPDVRRPRIDRAGPDAEMIRTGKVKTKTIRA
jgi:hypothetical protein